MKSVACTWGLIVALMAVMLTSCGSGNNALDPRFQPEVSNTTDNFQFQTTGVTRVTQTLDYTWNNTGIRASINQASAITAGQAVLTIRDANGNPVYSGDLAANGTFTSIAGTSGNWNIHIVLTGVSGTLNFRVQMAP